MLYRPFEEDHEANLRSNRNMSCLNNGNNSICPVERFQNDDPPKYSPPPSYSTATGAKLAKILRQSFRRSVRRILGESTITRPVLSVPHEFHSEQISYPINNSIEIVVESTSNVSQSLEFEDRPCVYGRSLSLGRKHIFNKSRFKETVENPLGGQSYNKNSIYNRRSSHKLRNRQFTAEDVKSILGSSTLGRRRGPQRIQMLYRPFEEDHEANLRSNRNMSCLNNGNNSICPVERFQNDDPPKYSPPPSYSTATGAKLAKILRQSFRRSVRRILGESTITRPVLSVPHEFHSEQISYPINNSIEIVVESTSNVSQSLEFEDRPCVYGRSLSLGRKHIFNKSRFKETVENPLGGQSYNKNSHKLRNRQFTAEDVKSILGSSTLGRRRGPQVVQTEPTFRSIDNLVQNAEPINLSPSINHNQMNVNNEI